MDSHCNVSISAPLVLYIVPAVIGFVVIVTGIIFYFVYRWVTLINCVFYHKYELLMVMQACLNLFSRKVSYEKDLANMAWKLNYSDMNVYSTQHGGNVSFLFDELKTVQCRKCIQEKFSSSPENWMYILPKGRKTHLPTIHFTFIMSSFARIINIHTSATWVGTALIVSYSRCYVTLAWWDFRILSTLELYCFIVINTVVLWNPFCIEIELTGWMNSDLSNKLNAKGFWNPARWGCSINIA